MNEEAVAFHDIVTLLGWRDSSSTGAKVTIGLASRVALEHFDKATRRRGKRAGQRYHAAFTDLNTQSALMGTELWFAGANWAHQDGARVTFVVQSEDLDWFRAQTAGDEHRGTPLVCWLTLVQIDDDESAVDQAKQARLEAVIEKPKGGPRSKQAAMLCQDAQFWQYVRSLDYGRLPCKDFIDADKFVKATIGIKSKAELDHDDAAWQRYIDSVRRPFFEWAGHGPG